MCVKGQKAWAHRQAHGIAEHLYEVLVQQAHVPGPKEANVFGPIVLEGYQLLQGEGRPALGLTDFRLQAEHCC